MIGEMVSHYRITEKIGAGGMGQVYKAHDERLGRDVAIKVLRQELASDPERLRRFEQEARSASALNHPNIIHIYDIGKHEATPYIAMEYVEGKTLRDMLSVGPLSTEKFLRFATQIAEGLAKAHSAGISPSYQTLDVKPLSERWSAPFSKRKRW
jgi:serine/threonine protein kinase